MRNKKNTLVQRSVKQLVVLLRMQLANQDETRIMRCTHDLICAFHLEHSSRTLPFYPPHQIYRSSCTCLLYFPVLMDFNHYIHSLLFSKAPSTPDLILYRFVIYISLVMLLILLHYQASLYIRSSPSTNVLQHLLSLKNTSQLLY